MKNVRSLSKYYYFIHPVCIVIIEQIGIAFELHFLSSGLVSFLLILILTHILSLFMINIQNYKAYLCIICSAISGLIITVFLTSLIFFFKNNEIIKFEFVPCLWFIVTLNQLYWFTKKKYNTHIISKHLN